MPLIKELLARPPNLPTMSKYTAISGVIYLAAGALLVAWPGATQALFTDRAFVGDEHGLVRVIGLTVAVIGCFYLFGGRSGARQIVAASVVNRLTFVPAVLLPLALSGVFPHLLVTFAMLDPALAIGAWLLFDRKTGAPHVLPVSSSEPTRRISSAGSLRMVRASRCQCRGGDFTKLRTPCARGVDAEGAPRRRHFKFLALRRCGGRQSPADPFRKVLTIRCEPNSSADPCLTFGP